MLVKFIPVSKLLWQQFVFILQPGQKFKLSNCTELICEGNNKVVVNQTVCPPVKEITCANKYPAILVPDENGCCYHYECQCKYRFKNYSFENKQKFAQNIRELRFPKVAFEIVVYSSTFTFMLTEIFSLCQVCAVDGVILIILLLMEPTILSLKTALMFWWNRLCLNLTTSVFTLRITTVIQKMDFPVLNPLLFSTNLQQWSWPVNSWMAWWQMW